MPVIPLTEEQIRDGLESGFSLDPADQFTYSIPGAGSTWESDAGNYDGANPQPSTNYSTLSAGQADRFIASIIAWDELIAPNFTQVADDGAGHGEVRAAFTSHGMGGSTAAYAFQGSNQTPTSTARIGRVARERVTTFIEAGGQPLQPSSANIAVKIRDAASKSLARKNTHATTTAEKVIATPSGRGIFQPRVTACQAWLTHR